MKKSILSLGAAVALSGLGFAGSAHAFAFFGAGATPASTASVVELAPGGVGHMLFQPYFSAQGTMATMLSITNTDRVNGKAVKVRFRGAANSDDVLDFTLFLSPGDVWTGSLSKNGDGAAKLTTADKSCTLPQASAWPAPLNPLRVFGNELVQTQEGYVEILNMADVPQKLTVAGAGLNDGKAVGDTNLLYTAIKHVDGVAPCTPASFAELINTTVLTAPDVEARGLTAPSGGLMGSWAVITQDQLAVYGGAMTAVSANAAAGTPGGLGNIAFAPQVSTPVVGADMKKVTADPLLSGATPIITPLWFDLPDMSTPLASTYADDPFKQADALSTALAKARVMNDYVGTADDAAVPMQTDWVVSQPTRRYHAAVDYKTKDIVWNSEMTSAATQVTTDPADATKNRYSGLKLQEVNGAPLACLTATLANTGREEESTVPDGSEFSPGAVAPASLYCGEVFTISFNSDSSKVLQSAVANRGVTALAEAGWAELTLGSGTPALPVVGFAATSMKNGLTNGNFGLTLPHRW